MRASAVLAVACVFAVTLSVQGVPVEAGQQSGEQQQEQQKDQKDQAQKDREQKSELSKGLKPGTAKASDVIGKNVQNPQGENLGKIKDVLVDPKDAKAAFVVFDATTGFFQNLFQGRDHYLILPWEHVTFAEGKFSANLNKQQLVQVPSFASDAWPRMDTQYREKVKGYYQQAGGPQPQVQTAGQDSAQAASAQAAQGSTPQAASTPPEAAPSSEQTSTASSGQEQSSQPSSQGAVPPEASASSGTSAAGGTEGQASSGSSSGSGTDPSQSAGASSPSGAQGGAASSAGTTSSGAPAQPAQASSAGQGGKYGKDAILVGDLIRASQFIGKEVRNQQNERLGKVEDLVLDLRAGQVAYTVLAQGGVLGIGEKLFAIPLQAFKAPEAGDRILLVADKEQVAKAPGFDKDNWPAAANPYWSQKSRS